MDVFSLLSYINKVSLIAFFITTIVVAYQIYNLRKEKTKEQTPTIPDFKEKNNFDVIANYTSLPSSLTKKKLKSVNYSRLVFLTISLLTIIVVIFVVSLVKKNDNIHNEALNNTVPEPTPTPKNNLLPSPTGITPTDINSTIITPTDILPTHIVPTVESQLTIEPTEIILAKNPSLTPEVSPTDPTEVAVSKPQVLPETGSWGKGLLIIGVAISTIFFSFLL